MSEELTEKLKQGNLKDGYYYAKMPTGCVDVVSLYNLRQLRLAKDGDKIEVLDIVPDYYQFQNICKSLSEEHRGNYNLMEENEKLKELLKECCPYISHSAVSRMIKNSAGHKKDMKLLTKIDKTLGVR